MKKFILSLVVLALVSSSATATTRNLSPELAEKAATVQSENAAAETVESQVETDGETDLFYDHAELESPDSEPQFESELESL